MLSRSFRALTDEASVAGLRLHIVSSIWAFPSSSRPGSREVRLVRSIVGAESDIAIDSKFLNGILGQLAARHVARPVNQQAAYNIFDWQLRYRLVLLDDMLGEGTRKGVKVLL